uniref:Uncharacterized protein n=1 Tax=Sphaerodactylus townsendi TaxID=933632 RepID=A0ACB8E775_9SAUR
MSPAKNNSAGAAIQPSGFLHKPDLKVDGNLYPTFLYKVIHRSICVDHKQEVNDNSFFSSPHPVKQTSSVKGCLPKFTYPVTYKRTERDDTGDMCYISPIIFKVLSRKQYVVPSYFRQLYLASLTTALIRYRILQK